MVKRKLAGRQDQRAPGAPGPDWYFLGRRPRNDRTLTVTEVKERNRDRVARRQVDKFAERRAQLAAAALQTLAERGYANTSLRDIAQNSEFCAISRRLVRA